MQTDTANGTALRLTHTHKRKFTHTNAGSKARGNGLPSRQTVVPRDQSLEPEGTNCPGPTSTSQTMHWHAGTQSAQALRITGRLALAVHWPASESVAARARVTCVCHGTVPLAVCAPVPLRGWQWHWQCVLALVCSTKTDSDVACPSPTRSHIGS